MKNFLRYRILTEIAPDISATHSNKLEWILAEVLRLYPSRNKEIAVLKIYAAYSQFILFPPRAQNEHKYLNEWNSARSDLIAREVDPPEKIPPPETTTRLQLEPEGDLSYWLASYLLGLSETEVRNVAAVYDLLNPGRSLLPLLKQAKSVLKEVAVKDDGLLTRYHRTRYLLLNFYLDAHYHEV